MLRYRNVRVPQDALNRQIVHQEFVQVGRESSAERMPAVPLRKRLVWNVLVVLLAMIVLRAAALPSLLDGRQDLIAQHIVQAQRCTLPRLKHDTNLGIATARPVLIEQLAQR